MALEEITLTDKIEVIANATWTDEVIAAYQASLPATEPESTATETPTEA